VRYASPSDDYITRTGTTPGAKKPMTPRPGITGPPGAFETLSRATRDPNPSKRVNFLLGGEGPELRPLLGDCSQREYNDHEMDDARNPEEEQRERPRPRVVDRRVSARGERAGPTPAPAAPSGPPPEPAETHPGPAAPQDTGPAGEAPLWTPEQEAEAQRFAQQVVETPSREWVVNTAVTLANVAAAKLEAGAGADAQTAIDALAGIVGGVGPRLGDAEGPLRQTLAQLQMAFAQGAGPIVPGPAGG
jgi:hypothetical protein